MLKYIKDWYYHSDESQDRRDSYFSANNFNYSVGLATQHLSETEISARVGSDFVSYSIHRDSRDCFRFFLVALVLRFVLVFLGDSIALSAVEDWHAFREVSSMLSMCFAGVAFIVSFIVVVEIHSWLYNKPTNWGARFWYSFSPLCLALFPWVYGPSLIAQYFFLFTEIASLFVWMTSGIK
jgi:hypothetical protein